MDGTETQPIADGVSDGDSIAIGEPIPINDDSDTGSEGIPIVEPSGIVIASDPGESGSGKRRGRPRGSRNANTKSTQKEVRSDLTGLLLSLHMMGSVMLKAPELAIDEDEAKLLGDAVARVNREFGVEIMSPKTAAIVNLTIAMGTVYGPRLLAARNRKKKSKANGVDKDASTYIDDVFSSGQVPHPTI